jgi:magnesium-protoporphyrin O-methyltransferase
MSHLSYEQRRSQIETYFDRTASDAWAKLTSDAPVGRIRATVRAGRDEMHATLLDWLPNDLLGFRLLDAGCGTGALSVAAAQRGASVVAVDLSPTLVELARQRLPSSLGLGEIDFRSGDMLSPSLGEFDFVVGMDSLIHYRAPDAVKALAALAQRTRHGLLFTFAPSNPLLAAMHAVGKLFPRGDRSPAIEPVSPARLCRLIGAEPLLSGWRQGRTQRVKSGFYTSQALEILRT